MWIKVSNVRRLGGLVAGATVLFVADAAKADPDAGAASATGGASGIVSFSVAEQLVYEAEPGEIRRNTASGVEDPAVVELAGNKLLTCARTSTPSNNKSEGFCGVMQLKRDRRPVDGCGVQAGHQLPEEPRLHEGHPGRQAGGKLGGGLVCLDHRQSQ